MSTSDIKTSAKISIASLYTLKAVCALLVVILHTPLGSMTEPLRTISEIAVPAFFMISGYFLYTDDLKTLAQKAKRTIIKLLPIIAIMHTFYTLIAIDRVPSTSEYMLWVKWLVLGFHPIAGHLWYLTALLQGLITIYIISKLGWRWALYTLPLLYIVQAIGGSWRELIWGSPSSILNSNVITYALPFLSLGLLIRQKENWLYPVFFYSHYIAFGSVLLLLFNDHWLIDISWTASKGAKPIIQIIYFISTFLVTLRYKSFGEGTFIERIGRDYSSNIYYFHATFIYLNTLIAIPAYDSIGAIIVFTLSLGTAWLSKWSQNRLDINVLP